MNHKELVDQVTSNIIKASGKLESRRSWIVMRNYLQQLSCNELEDLLNDLT